MHSIMAEVSTEAKRETGKEDEVVLNSLLTIKSIKNNYWCSEREIEWAIKYHI